MSTLKKIGKWSLKIAGTAVVAVVAVVAFGAIAAKAGFNLPLIGGDKDGQ